MKPFLKCNRSDCHFSAPIYNEYGDRIGTQCNMLNAHTKKKPCKFFVTSREFAKRKEEAQIKRAELEKDTEFWTFFELWKIKVKKAELRGDLIFRDPRKIWRM